MGGRHAAQKDPRPGVSRRTTAVLAVSGTLGTGALLSATGEAHSASLSVWERVAQCESSGNWEINTGNGYFGGLQFAPSTWKAYGGTAFAARADLASKSEQIKIAERVLTTGFNGHRPQGPGAWPVCGREAGLRAGTAAPAVSVPAQFQKAVTAPRGALPNLTAARAVAFARAQIGKPYVFGAEGPNSFDCSGLTQAAWKAAGISIPRTSQAQAAGMQRVARSAMQPGDLIIFKADNGHVAMYAGNNRIVEAPRPGKSVQEVSLSGSWYQDNFRMVVRPAGIGPLITLPGAGGSSSTGAAEDPPAPKPAPEAPATTGKVHVVVPGDTLSSIAEGADIKGGWPALYKANIRVVGDSPHLIYPGQRIRLS